MFEQAGDHTLIRGGRRVPGDIIGTGRSHRRRASLAAVTVVVLALLVLLIRNLYGPAPALQQALGMRDAGAAPVPDTASIIVSPATTGFAPRVAAVLSGSTITFVNELAVPLSIRSTVSSPTSFTVSVAPHGRTTFSLRTIGLYQYYDTRSARPGQVVAGSTVLRGMPTGSVPRQGWIAVLGSVPGLHSMLLVPKDHDLFAPKALVTVVGSTIVVANHDADAHNFVIDPASPVGAAFIVTGTDGEPPTGWQRALVVQQPGLYHVYCTLHTEVMAIEGGWHMVMPRPKASGYADGDAMEAWIVVLPAATSL
jgi:plastocyanin